MIKNYKLKIIPLLISLLCTILFISICFANTNEKNEVTIKANESIEKLSSLLCDCKEVYGLKDKDDSYILQNTHLGEGYEYYKIAYQNLEKQNFVPSSIDNIILNTQKYIFPIKVGNKDIGIAFFEKKEGEWRLFRIKADSSFRTNIDEAKNIVKDKLDNLDDLNNLLLLYDIRSNLVGLSYQGSNGNEIISINDNITLNLMKNETKQLPDLSEDILEFHKNIKSVEKHKGGDSILQPSLKSNSYVLILLFCIVITFITIFSKKVIYK